MASRDRREIGISHFERDRSREQLTALQPVRRLCRHAPDFVSHLTESAVDGGLIDEIVPVAGSEFEIATDMVVFAIGTNANPILGQTSKLKLNKRGYIDTDADLATSVAGVFAGGDIVTGAATVIEAMGAGRKAAQAMKAYLGLRDTDTVYEPAGGTRFGIPAGEHNLARVRLA